METNDRGDAAECTQAENENKRKLLAVWPLNAKESLYWEGKDPNVGNNIEGGCSCCEDMSVMDEDALLRMKRTVEKGGGIDTTALYQSRQIPHLVERNALDETADDTDDDENGQ